MKEKRKCEVCGKAFISRRSTQVTCSPSCRQKRAYRMNHLTAAESKRAPSGLEEKNRAALASGMSYGQWQALRYKETHNI